MEKQNTEKATQVQPQQAQPEVGFIQLFKGSLLFFGKHWWQYIKLGLLILIPMLILGLLVIFAPAVIGILALVYMLIIFYATLCFVRLTVTLEQDSKPAAGSILAWGSKKIGSYIALIFRILFYVAWPLLIILIGFTIAQILSADLSNQIGSILNYFLGAAGLAALVFMMIRGPRTIFSMYVLADQDTDSKTALQTSVGLSMGNWWKIFFYALGFGLIVGIGNALITFLVSLADQTAAGIVNFLVSILAGFLGYVFYFVFYRVLQAKK